MDKTICVYLAPLWRYGASKIMGLRVWPFRVTWRDDVSCTYGWYCRRGDAVGTAICGVEKRNQKAVKRIQKKIMRAKSTLDWSQSKILIYCIVITAPHFGWGCALDPTGSHSGVGGNILAGSPNIFTGPLWRENFGIFFKMVHSGVLYIFGRRLGPPNVAGHGVAYSPFPTLSKGGKESKDPQFTFLAMPLFSTIDVKNIFMFLNKSLKTCFFVFQNVFIYLYKFFKNVIKCFCAF